MGPKNILINMVLHFCGDFLSKFDAAFYGGWFYWCFCLETLHLSLKYVVSSVLLYGHLLFLHILFAVVSHYMFSVTPLYRGACYHPGGI